MFKYDIKYIHTVILFSSRYLFPAKSICPIHANKRYKFSCQSVLLLHPIESFAIFLSKFVLLGTKITWRWAPIETRSIFVGANRNTQHICVKIYAAGVPADNCWGRRFKSRWGQWWKSCFPLLKWCILKGLFKHV